MVVREITPGEDLGTRRGDVVVCLIGAGTAAETAIETGTLVVAAGPRLSPSSVLAASAPADIVLLAADATPAPGLLRRLRATAAGEAAVATVSAVAGAADPEAATRAAVNALEGALPTMTGPAGPAVLVRRAALELVGDADAVGDDGRLTAAFLGRCEQVGLRHLLAPGAVITTSGIRAARDLGEQAEPAAERALAAVRRTTSGLRVAIDARMVVGVPDGSRVHALELIGAVARTRRCALTVLAGEALDADARTSLAALPNCEVLTLASGQPAPTDRRFDLVHRPFQLSAPADLAALTALAPRLVVTHQDLIAFHNPAYFASPQLWSGYRSVTRQALAVADEVVFFSEHARRDALGEELVDVARSTVIPIGVDHVLGTASPAAPSPTDRPADGLLCLGADYFHKNRVFALKVADALAQEHGWQGRLIFAGPHMKHGSSRQAEAALLTARPDLASRVSDLGAVAEADKRRLLDEAAIVLYPSVHEGFGLIPFEAADHGRACLWAPGSALAEMLRGIDGGIVPWSASLTARRAATLLADPSARAESVARVRSAAVGLGWEQTANALLDLYARVCARPPNLAGAAARADGPLGGRISEDAMRLVGPGGVLPADVERPLLALFSKPPLARAAQMLLRSGYRASGRRA